MQRIVRDDNVQADMSGALSAASGMLQSSLIDNFGNTNVCIAPIVLKKSFWGDERNFQDR